LPESVHPLTESLRRHRWLYGILLSGIVMAAFGLVVLFMEQVPAVGSPPVSLVGEPMAVTLANVLIPLGAAFIITGAVSIRMMSTTDVAQNLYRKIDEQTAIMNANHAETVAILKTISEGIVTLTEEIRAMRKDIADAFARTDAKLGRIDDMLGRIERAVGSKQ